MDIWTKNCGIIYGDKKGGQYETILVKTHRNWLSSLHCETQERLKPFAF